MRDFPVFTTEHGVSSLILKEIPYRKQAFICIRDVQPDGFAGHLAECVSFCKMAGADHIFAAGHPQLEQYPLYTRVVKMRGQPKIDVSDLAQLFPVTEQTVTQWRQIHNEAMARVDNAGTLEGRDEKRILESGGAYFVHEKGQLLGIGWMVDHVLLAIASVVPGAGTRVMQTLMSLYPDEPITLEVASTNKRAISLYERLGFLSVEEISCWHRVG